MWSGRGLCAEEHGRRPADQRRVAERGGSGAEVSMYIAARGRGRGQGAAQGLDSPTGSPLWDARSLVIDKIG